MHGAGPDAPAHHSPVPSPDGTLLAWISDVTGRPRVHVAPLPSAGPVTGGRVLDAGGIDRPDAVSLAWSPDGGRVAAEIAPSGGDRHRVLVLDPAGGPATEIAPAAACVTLGAWSPTGRHLGVTLFPGSGDPAADGYGAGTACLVDTRDGSSVVVGSGQAAAVQAISADARRVVLRTGRRGERRLELLDLHTGSRDRLVGGRAFVATARFGTSPGTLWVHTDAGREHAALLAVALGPAADHRIAPARVVAGRSDADLDVAALDPSSTHAVLVWNAGGRTELEVADLRGGRPRGLAAPMDVVTGVSVTRDGRSVLVAGHSPGAPPHVVRVPLDGSAPATPLLPATPWRTTTRPEPVAFDAEDGLELRGWLHRPAAPNGVGLLWFHGGPESEERPGWAPLMAALAAAGVTVLTPNVRGSSGRGDTFARLDDRELRPFSLTDVRASARFLAGTGGVERVVVAGRSYGGFLTLAALTRFPELFAAGVDVCGMSDLPAFYAGTEPWIAGPAVPEYGDPRTDRALLDELSPLADAATITAPLLVVHGEHDTNVPVGQAHAIVDALTGRGRPVELLLVPDEGHEIADRATRAATNERIVAWVCAAAGRPAVSPG
ncbi:alpha/beta fold hydrolase [Pseudonocardia phyllosphaerae]|uniref:alpha/beta fold hydrolase n=1 Tax=Pseudonocardia phyllosphaerae TaxID=3390502 RepID=UPI003979F67E